MRKRIFTSSIAALALFTFVGLVAALAIAWPNLARAHSPGGASLTALTVTSDATALTLMPTFDSAVHYYTIPVADTVIQITIVATPEDDGTRGLSEHGRDDAHGRQRVRQRPAGEPSPRPASASTWW